MNETEEKPLQESARLRPRRPLVVCVDDDPRVLGALSRLLGREPYEFRTTTDPEKALEWVRVGTVALLIADYRMPTLSGTALLEFAKASSPWTERLMLTGYAGETNVLAAGNGGLMQLVGKPWDDGELKRKIRELLRLPPAPWLP